MSYTKTSFSGCPAYIYIPDNTTGRLPTFVFIPGINETSTNSSNISAVNKYGPGYYLSATTPWKPNFIVICLYTPQWPGSGTVDGYINAIRAHSRVDNTKIYGTGLSHGAYTWLRYALTSATYSSKLAGMVVMSSPSVDSLYYTDKKFYLQHLPIWDFHGNTDTDSSHPLSAAVAMTNDMKSRGFPVKFTIYTGGHCCWNTLYSPTYNAPVYGGTVYAEMLKYSTISNSTITTTQPPTTTTTTHAPTTTTLAPTTTLPLTTTTKAPTTTIAPTTTAAPTTIAPSTTTTKPPIPLLVTFTSNITLTNSVENLMYTNASSAVTIFLPTPANAAGFYITRLRNRNAQVINFSEPLFFTPGSSLTNVSEDACYHIFYDTQTAKYWIIKY